MISNIYTEWVYSNTAMRDPSAFANFMKFVLLLLKICCWMMIDAIYAFIEYKFVQVHNTETSEFVPPCTLRAEAL